MTELEARKFLEKIFQKDSSVDVSSQEIKTAGTDMSDAELEKEIQTLTEQIIVLKTELETLRQGQPSDQ